MEHTTAAENSAQELMHQGVFSLEIQLIMRYRVEMRGAGVEMRGLKCHQRISTLTNTTVLSPLEWRMLSGQ